MVPQISYVTLAAARLAALDAFDTAVREGLADGAKTVGVDDALSAFAARPSSAPALTAKAA